MTAPFTHEDARRFYDRLGSKQDSQAFYEDGALDILIAEARFEDAHSVLEIGCGTGRFGARLLEDHLPADASYTGIDVSETMIGLAQERLAPWADRVAVHRTEGGFDFSGLGGPFDRVVATYVFDLLSPEDIAAALEASHRALNKGGYLCTAGLTEGCSVMSRATMGIWKFVRRLNPSLVGGCRPLVLADLLPPDQWRVAHAETVVNVTVPSEVMVAEAL